MHVKSVSGTEYYEYAFSPIKTFERQNTFATVQWNSYNNASVSPRYFLAESSMSLMEGRNLILLFEKRFAFRKKNCFYKRQFCLKKLKLKLFL